MFTSRDIEQTADLEKAAMVELKSNSDVLINEAGTYLLSGDFRNTVIIVETDREDKGQLVLDKLTILNDDMPGVYVKSADKVFITTTDSPSAISVTGSYEKDGETIKVVGGSSFDADGTALLKGDRVTINGESVNGLPESRMGRGRKH